jgi:acyl-CoA hydrolase
LVRGAVYTFDREVVACYRRFVTDEDPAPARTPRASRVETVQLVLPGLTNVHGTVFGGILMQWIDIAAAIAASRHSGEPVVTASMDRLHFLRPVRLGGVVVVQSQVNFVARTSMEVGVRVYVEDRRTRAREQTTRAYLTMVAVDDQGRPVPVPPLEPENDEDRRRMAEGQRRREVRLAERRAIEQGHG